MFDRLTSSKRAVWTTFAATGALFLVLVVLLGVQMALGRDPSMGDRSATGPAPGGQRHAVVPQQQQIPETYGDGDGRGYDDGYGYPDRGYDEGYGEQYGGGPGYDDGSGYGYPQQQAPQQQVPQQQGPPLQSGTS